MKKALRSLWVAQSAIIQLIQILPGALSVEALCDREAVNIANKESPQVSAHALSAEPLPS